MKKNKIKNIIEKSPFVNSFKLDKRFWKVLLLNLIFIVLLLSLIPLYTFILRLNLDAMKPLDESAIRIKEVVEGNRELDKAIMQDLELTSSAIKLFFLKTSVISIVFLVILLAVIGYFTAKIWYRIIKEKFDKHIVFKLSLLALIWNLIWLILFLVSIFALKFNMDTITIIATIEFFIYVYFSLLIIPIFFRNKEIVKSIKKTFSIGTLKFHVIFPSIIAIWLILSISLGLVTNLALSFPIISLIVAIPLALLYITWLKFYINNVIDRIYHTS